MSAQIRGFNKDKTKHECSESESQENGLGWDIYGQVSKKTLKFQRLNQIIEIQNSTSTIFR